MSDHKSVFIKEAAEPSFQGYGSHSAQSNTDTYRYQHDLQKDDLSVKPTCNMTPSIYGALTGTYIRIRCLKAL